MKNSLKEEREDEKIHPPILLDYEKKSFRIPLFEK